MKKEKGNAFLRDSSKYINKILGHLHSPHGTTMKGGESESIMTMEERLLREIFSKPKQIKNIHELSAEEANKCADGYNTAIEIIIDGRILVTGGTLEERCVITDSDVNMANNLKMTSVEDILKVVNEEDVVLYIFDDIIMVMSDIHFVSYEDETSCLPISTDLSLFEGTNVEINDLR